MTRYDTLVHVVSLDTIIEAYIKDLHPSDPNVKVVSKIPYVDIQKNKVVVVIGVEKES